MNSETQNNHDLLEIIMSFVRLCRSGDHKTADSVFDRLMRQYEGLTRKELEVIVKPAINGMCSHLFVPQGE